jgi:hypothetical protein
MLLIAAMAKRIELNYSMGAGGSNTKKDMLFLLYSSS